MIDLEQVQVVEAEQFPCTTGIEGLIALAIREKSPTDALGKLLAMRKELLAEQAKTAYDQAMAAFQAECPTIQKTKGVKGNNDKVAYRYAPIESIVEQVRHLLSKHGFSYSTSMELLDSGVKVCVKVTHAAGHSETSCMTVPLGTKTQIMSQTQVVAAAVTFAKRYAFCNAFGILTGDEDNDANSVPKGTPTPARQQPPQARATPPASTVKQEQAKTRFTPATDEQKNAIRCLCQELGESLPQDLARITGLAASEWISTLTARREQAKQAVAQPQQSEQEKPAAATEQATNAVSQSDIEALRTRWALVCCIQPKDIAVRWAKYLQYLLQITEPELNKYHLIAIQRDIEKREAEAAQPKAS